MKRKTLKRKISIVGILVFVSMIVYSCWQDEWSSNVTDEVIFDSNKELTIAKAEQWYNATNPSATTVRSLSAGVKIVFYLIKQVIFNNFITRNTIYIFN